MGLITIQQLKRKTSIGGNVDPDKVMHLVDDAEALVLEPQLGTKLYEKIVTDYNEGGTNNLSGDYLEMYNKYIVAILCYSVYAEYLLDGAILAQNTGIYENVPDGSTTAELAKVERAAKTNKSKADVYLERLQRYLCDKNIPEYDNAQDNDYDIDPREVNTISGWYLPRTDAQNNNLGLGGSSGNYLLLEDDQEIEL